MKIKFKKLKSIKQVSVGKTYDFAVMDEHRIIARESGTNNGFYTSNCSHPDIEEFITSKQTPGRLTKFNMSILVSDEFIEAVNKKKPWNLEFPDYNNHMKEYEKEWDGNLAKWKEAGYPTVVYKTFEDANELWDLIMESTYNRNEPGILFSDTINKMNNLHYCEHISATNPCVVGDTKVAVANGENGITIADLAEIGEDVPVYCLDDRNKICVRTMRSPRITGYNKPIYKVTIENGHTIRVTGNHKFRLKNGEYKMTKDLKHGDSLYTLNKFDAAFEEVFENSNSHSQDYTWFREGGKKVVKSEHRLVAEFHNNSDIPTGHVVHHIDYDASNNKPENLQVMSREDHTKLHTENMFGDKNPMRRAQTEWSDEKWNTYRENMSEATSGEKNGRYSGITEDDFRKLALELTEKLGRRFSTKEWYEYCESNDCKYSHTNWRIKKLGTIKALGIWAGLKLGYDEYLNEDPRMVRNLEKWTSEGYNCRIGEGGLVYIKECEVCNTEFETLLREHSVCGHECNNKRTAKRNQTPEFIEKCTNAQREQKAIYKENMRDIQLKIYSQLKFDTKKEPMRSEWEEACKSEGVAYRLGKSSPFVNFTELRKEAVYYNHKVISVELDGYENVYNGTVDDFHNFFVGEFIEPKENGKRNYLYINNLQCGEQLLPIGGVCLLGSINLTQFVDFSNKDWDYDKLKKLIPIAVRFMDNVNDITNVPLPEQKQNLKDKRRIGLGIMGYGSALMMLKMRYGSKKAIEITDKLMKFIMNEAYRASSLIAKEKGSFLLFDEKEYLSGNFVKNLDKSVISSIKKNGIRNSHLLSIQPTGNSSILSNVVSGGLEPIFMPEYKRTSMMPYPPEGLNEPKNIDWDNKTYSSDTVWNWIKEGDENLLSTNFEGYTWKYDKSRGLLRETVVKDYAVRFLEELGEWKSDAKWAATTTELSIDEHVKTMDVLSRYIDSAMSKCVVKGTLITTDKGIIPIENMSEEHDSEDSFKNTNNEYKVLDENGDLKNITSHYYGGYKECFEIKFKNGFKIDSAYTHKFKTEEGWKSVLDLKVGDKIYHRTNNINNNNEYLNITNPPIFVGNFKKYNFPTKIDEKYAKFLGMLISDGSININSIGIIEKDDNVSHLANELIFDLFGEVKTSIDKRSNVKYHYINSRTLSKYFRNYIGENALTKSIPDDILLSNDNVKLAFLEGLTLDGYIKDDKNLVIYEGYSEDCALKVSYILNSLGYDYYLGTKNVKNGRLSDKSYMVKAYLTDKKIKPIEEHKYEYTTSGRKQKQVFVNNNEKYKSLPKSNDINYNSFSNLRKSLKSSSFTRKELLDKLNIDYDDNLTCVEIKSITSIGKQEVYDIEVEDTHSYLINGVVSHNTVNITKDYPYDDFKKLYSKLHKTGTVKGCTTYRAGTMTEVLSSNEKFDTNASREETHKIIKTQAPHRDKSMKCDIHHVTAQGKKWIVIVGLLANEPYEVFAFKPKFITLPTSVTEGNLVKIKRGYYNLECSNGLIIENITENFETDEQEALTRLISTALRHGADIQFVFEQLNKSEGTITSFSKAIGRTLKKYLKDGTKSSDVCEECGAKDSMVYQEGCLICNQCSWSRCG